MMNRHRKEAKNMYRNFDEMLNKIKENPQKKKIVVAAAHDHEVLECAVTAKKEQIADFILIGKEDRIREILSKLGENPDIWTILAEPSDPKAAALAASMASKGEADALMKGLLQTSTFLRALFQKGLGLVPHKTIVSQITVCEYPAQDRLLLITDCAVNVTPGFDEKIKLIQNAVSLAQKIDIPLPKVACIAPVEVINEKMPETIDAAMLSKACERGQIKNCIVDGPLALDNAISPDAAKIKGITSKVAGSADILLMPNLCTGNAIYKALHYFAGLKTGSAVVGAKVPVILTSRSDTAQSKLHAVALSVL